MDNFQKGVLLIILGFLLIIWTFIENKSTPARFSNSYINHLKGFIGGVGLVLYGFIKLLN